MMYIKDGVLYTHSMMLTPVKETESERARERELNSYGFDFTIFVRCFS